MKDLVGYFLFTFTSLFTIVNPLSAMPLYLSLTEGMSKGEATAFAKRASVAAFAAMLAFAFGGNFLFNFFSVSTDSLRVVGGVLFFLSGYDMLLGQTARIKTPDADEMINRQQFAITPLAIPMICGPGAITIVLVAIEDASTNAKVLLLVVAILIVALLTYAFLLGAKRITELLGANGTKVFLRIMGLIIMMIAVEFFFAGATPFLRKIFH
jgi:multiple antibiotic resistance protein